MSTFTSCPLAFRFSYIDRLPEAAVGAREQGHPRAPRPPAPDVAAAGRAHDRERRSSISPGRSAEVATDPEFAQLDLTDEEWAGFHADAEVLAAAVLRDRGSHADHACSASSSGSPPRPPTVSSSAGSSTGSSSTPTASSSSPTTRPAASPSEGWEQQSLAGVHVYSLLCERMFGRRPAAGAAPLPLEAGADHHPAERPVGARRRGEVGRGDEGGAQRVRTRRLPAPRVGAVRVLLVPRVLPRVRRRSGPGRAGDARAPSRARRPTAAAARHRLSRASRPRCARRSSSGTSRSTAPSTACAVPPSTASSYRLSSAADHSLLWHLCGSVTAIARGGDLALRGPLRRRAMGVESLLTNGVVKSAFRRVRPGRVRRHRVHATDCAARSRARSRPGTRRRRSARRDCSAAGRAGTRLAAAVASTRVYVRLHHASDVVAGAAFGLVLGRRSADSCDRRCRLASAPIRGMMSSSPGWQQDRIIWRSRDPPVRRELRLPLPLRPQRATSRSSPGSRAGRDWDVRFLPFSLDQVHVEEGEPPVWDRDPDERGTGVLALCWGIAVRDSFPDHFLDWHIAAFAARHDEGAKIAQGRSPARDRDVGRPRRRRGRGRGRVGPAAEDRSPTSTPKRSNAGSVFGVPTFFVGERAAFVRVMDRNIPDRRRPRARSPRVDRSQRVQAHQRSPLATG